MNVKEVFKKIWRGIKVAEPYLQALGTLLPPPFGVILLALDQIIEQAEVTFPAEGSGVLKAEFFSLKGLQVMEILTGKNVDNPKTRVLVARIGSTAVKIKNLKAEIVMLEHEYAQIVKEIKEAVESVKAPAIPDAP